MDNEMGTPHPPRQPSFCWADADKVLPAEILFVSVLYSVFNSTMHSMIIYLLASTFIYNFFLIYF